MINVNVYGLGYIGLPTALFFATNGVQVAGFDSSEKIRSLLIDGKCPHPEPGLDAMLKHAYELDTFEIGSSVLPANFHIICVPTPLQKRESESPSADLSAVLSVVNQIASVLRSDDVVILESTSPVGTSDKIYESLCEVTQIKDFGVAYCPERVLPGNLISEMTANARVVGANCQVVANRVSDLYRLICDGDIHVTQSRTAEMCKLVENSYRDVNIAFANSIDMIASDLGVITEDLLAIANLHPRVNILSPGIGVGGHCIPIDPWFLISGSSNSDLLVTARRVNLMKTNRVSRRIKDVIDDRSVALGRAPKVAILGLTYKADVGDLRESPAVEITKQLVDWGYKITVHEPHAQVMGFEQSLDHIALLKESDIAFILQRHERYADVVCDGQRIYEAGLIGSI